MKRILLFSGGGGRAQAAALQIVEDIFAQDELQNKIGGGTLLEARAKSMVCNKDEKAKSKLEEVIHN